MAPAVVRTERLTKDFVTGLGRSRALRALDALSLEVPAGGIFGLLGPNGAGKTTALKLLVGLLRPTSGLAEVFGRPAGGRDQRQRLGFLPEQPVFYDYLTGEELLLYFAGLFGYTGQDRRRRVGALLDRVGVGGERRRPLRQYSKGTIQRIGLAQALVNDAELLLLDEPMADLDPIGRHDVRQLMLELRDQGRTILFSSHILSEAELLCSGVAILSRGALVAAGTLAELTVDAGRGTEVVVANLQAEAADTAARSVRRVRRIGDGRYSFELDPGVRPESLIADLAAAGAVLVAVTPLRDTLEDVFLKAVDHSLPASKASERPAAAPKDATAPERDRTEVGP